LLQQCTVCQFDTDDKEQFARHVADVHGCGPPKVCSVCNSFASFSELELWQHISVTHRDEVPSSASCLESLNRPYSIHLPGNNSTVSSLRVSPHVLLSELSSSSESESDTDSV
jgi:hypothetical protein